MVQPFAVFLPRSGKRTGGKDPRCPAGDSLDTRDKLVQLGKEVELLLYENEAHVFLNRDNVIHSEQNAFERGLNAAIPALAGADELSGIGEMEAGVMRLVRPNGPRQRACRECDAAPQGLADIEHLAVEIIGNAVNGTRNFLAQRHTMKHLRAGEMALTHLAEPNSWDTWEEKLERRQMADHSVDEAERILREHRVPPLEPQQEQELDRILAAAAKETAKRN